MVTLDAPKYDAEKMCRLVIASWEYESFRELILLYMAHHIPKPILGRWAQHEIRPVNGLGKNRGGV